MTREDLLRSPEYWITGIQIDLYNRAERYMKQHNLNRSQLAQQLGVSKGYVSQLLNGDYDHKLSKLVELALAFDCVPDVTFVPIESCVMAEQRVCVSRLFGVVEYRASDKKIEVSDFCGGENGWCVEKDRKEVA